MRFESPWMLLLLIPVAAVATWGLRRLVRNPPHLRIPTLVHAAGIHRGLHGRLVHLPAALIIAGMVLTVVALARPQVRDNENLSGEGVDFVIALDMSTSMNAVDIPLDRIKSLQIMGKEPPNRFQKAVEILKDFVQSRDSDRIGLVVFATHAYVKFPLTLDKQTVSQILDGLVLDNGLRSQSGNCTNGCTIMGDSTAIGDALARAFKRVEGSETKSRNIILITDGANNAGSAAPSSIADFIATESAQRPVKVFSFLIGDNVDTYWPATHPMTGQSLIGPDGLKVYEPIQNQANVNPDLLKEISQRTGGRFYEAPSARDFEQDFNDLEKTEFAAPAITNWKEVFTWPLGAAILLCLAGVALSMTVLRRWP